MKNSFAILVAAAVLLSGWGAQAWNQTIHLKTQLKLHHNEVVDVTYDAELVSAGSGGAKYEGQLNVDGAYQAGYPAYPIEFKAKGGGYKMYTRVMLQRADLDTNMYLSAQAPELKGSGSFTMHADIYREGWEQPIPGPGQPSAPQYVQYWQGAADGICKY